MILSEKIKPVLCCLLMTMIYSGSGINSWNGNADKELVDLYISLKW